MCVCVLCVYINSSIQWLYIAGLVDLTQASAIPKPRPANLQKNGCLVGGLSVSWVEGVETIQWAEAAGASVTDEKDLK